MSTAPIPEVDEHVAGAPVAVRPVAERVLTIVRDALPEAEEAFKWKRPVFEVGGKGVCYLAVSKQHVTLGFSRGRELTDPDGMLEGSGTRMAHLKLRGLEDLDEDRVRGWLREAEALETDGRDR